VNDSDEDTRVPSQTAVQLAVSKKRFVIPEEVTTEDSLVDIVLENPLKNSKKQLKLRDFNRNSNTGNRLHPVVSRKPTVDDHRKQTVFSDWGDDYDGLEDMRLSQPLRSLMLSENFSFSSDGPRSSNVRTIPGTTKMIISPGHVLVMQLTKGDPRFRLINLDSSLKDLVENFLSTNGVSLPISFTESENVRPKLMKENRMAMTIRDNLGRNLDVSTQGLTFSVGPLNSKLCYKMTVVDLSQLQKIFSLTHGGNYEGLIEEQDL